MGIERNKTIVENFIARTQVGSKEDAGEFVSKTARVWLSGLGLVRRDDIIAAWRGYDNGQILNVTAEDNRVAVEYQADTTRPDGSRYANMYHLLFFVEDAKIVEIREYSDTAHINTVFPGRVRDRDVALRPTDEEYWDGMDAIVVKRQTENL